MFSTLAKSDIFFFITAIAVVVLTVAIIVVLVYVGRIARSLSNIAKNAEEESQKGILATIISSIAGAFLNRTSKKKK